MSSVSIGDRIVFDLDALDAVIRRLAADGYRVVGPRLEHGAIGYHRVEAVGDLPAGCHDHQRSGRYAVEESGDSELFGWAVGPQSLKAHFFPPADVEWRSELESRRFAAGPAAPDAPLAAVGVRPCDVAALTLLDRVLLGGAYPDRRYAARRSGAFIVVAECAAPSQNCFCASMGTGPDAGASADLALIELDGAGGDHRFLVHVRSQPGAEVVAGVEHRDAEERDLGAREALLGRAREAMGVRLDAATVASLLAGNIDHPRWDAVGERCLACGNCTMVCPSCFCSDVHDVSDLAGEVARTRRWASCFELEHSYLHGGAVRVSIGSRYRQWATHKLSTWHDQFGSSGCVGCGRCITWCPAGIDLTAEVAAIAAEDLQVGADRG